MCSRVSTGLLRHCGDDEAVPDRKGSDRVQSGRWHSRPDYFQRPVGTAMSTKCLHPKGVDGCFLCTVGASNVNCCDYLLRGIVTCFVVRSFVIDFDDPYFTLLRVMIGCVVESRSKILFGILSFAGVNLGIIQQ